MNTTTTAAATLGDQLEIIDHRIAQALGIVWTLHREQDGIAPGSDLQNALWAAAELLRQARNASDASLRLELHSRRPVAT